MTRWDALYLAAAPAFLGAAWYKRLRHGKYRRSLPGMFGANLPRTPLPPLKHRVWMHSVSVGETVAAGTVFKLLKHDFPAWEFLSTTTTETGQDQSARSLAEANHRDFAPADFSWKVAAFLRAYNPSLYLLFETEWWPNALLACRGRGIPVFVVNGKLSERSAARYERAKGLLAQPLSAVRAFLMQTEADAERVARIAPAGADIRVTGNVKFDGLPAPLSPDERAAIRRGWALGSGQTLVLAGSTHPTEESMILDAWVAARAQAPDLALAIAPRHPERFDSVAQEIRARGLSVHRASSPDPAKAPPDVVLLDKMGVLARCFGAADIAIVGGAWKPIGGHNLLEPAAHGIPVLHGPHMHAQKEIMRIMERHRASIPVPAERLAEEIARLAADPARRAEAGARARDAATANAGAAHRSVAIVRELLGL